MTPWMAGEKLHQMLINLQIGSSNIEPSLAGHVSVCTTLKTPYLESGLLQASQGKAKGKCMWHNLISSPYQPRQLSRIYFPKARISEQGHLSHNTNISTTLRRSDLPIVDRTGPPHHNQPNALCNWGPHDTTYEAAKDRSTSARNISKGGIQKDATFNFQFSDMLC